MRAVSGPRSLARRGMAMDSSVSGSGNHPDIKVTTTLAFEGYRIKEYKGIVRGIIVRSPTIGQGLLGGLKSIVGGVIGSYVDMCEMARSQAYDACIQHARQMGANAILAVAYDSSEVGPGITEVLCYGTAAVIVRE